MAAAGAGTPQHDEALRGQSPRDRPVAWVYLGLARGPAGEPSLADRHDEVEEEPTSGIPVAGSDLLP